MVKRICLGGTAQVQWIISTNPVNSGITKNQVSVFVELYTKNHQLIAQEQKLIAINRSLENEIKERKISEAHVKELNQQLLENIDRLETANKNLDRFAFMSSHDLQEPLRKIRTFTDLLYSKYNLYLMITL
jgi:signal transduction histidine kinase